MHGRFTSILIALLLAGVVLLVISNASVGAEQKPESPPFTLKVDVDLVILNVAVVDDKGANVTHLRKEDFVVYEDDVEQELSDFLPVEAPFKLILALDTSISTRSSLTLIKQAAAKFTDQLRPSDQVAITQIDSRLREVQHFTNNRKKLKEAIGRIATSVIGGSRIYDGIAEALRSLQKVGGGRKAIILLSDGMENSSRTRFQELRRLLSQSDLVFYPVTVLNKGSQRDLLEDYIRNADKKKPELARYVENAKMSLSVLEEVYQIQTERLHTLTHETGGKLFLVGDLADLADEYAKVAHELRNTFSLAYYSKKKARDGTIRRVRVELKNPRYRARSRTSYFVPDN